MVELICELVLSKVMNRTYSHLHIRIWTVAGCVRSHADMSGVKANRLMFIVAYHWLLQFVSTVNIDCLT
jgi:hypothetical protein